MHPLTEINSEQDIPSGLKNHPAGMLLRYHNLNEPLGIHHKAELLIGMCMDNRNQLRIPANFAYIIRSGGANLRYSEFKVSFAIAMGGVKHIALIAHNDCGMVNLASKKEKYISGMVENAGWTASQAENLFNIHAPLFEISNETDFVLTEAVRLRDRFPAVSVTPMYYNVNNHKLYLIQE